MKKIVAIFVVVIAMFSACVESENITGPAKIEFPAEQNLTVESGKSYEIIFTAEEEWTVSLPTESQAYATLTLNGETDSEFSGEADVETTIVVNVKEGIVCYVEDIIFNVNITLAKQTRTLATLTLPKTENMIVESGKSYEITFMLDKPWMVSLPAESQVYATLTYDGVTDIQFYGDAGVESTIVVNVREGLMSYAKDFNFNIEITVDDEMQNLVTMTIPRVPYEITVTGSAPVGMENDVQSTFEQGGHPENGPFASAANTYTVRYLNSSDAKYGDYVVSHDCGLLYNYVVYAKSSADGEFEPVAGNSNAWLNLRTWKPSGKNNLALEMNHSHGKAVKTAGVGYEAYVNLEDENGDAIVSIYYIYDPTAVAPVKPAIELAYPDDAAAKGVTFVGDGTAYTLTLPTIDLLVENTKAASLKIPGYLGGGYTAENLKLVASDEDGIYYTAMVEGTTPDDLVRTNTLSVGATNSEGAKEYTITVIFAWAPEAEETPEVTPEETPEK